MKLSPEQINEARRLYNNGKGASFKELAKQFGVHHWTMRIYVLPGALKRRRELESLRQKKYRELRPHRDRRSDECLTEVRHLYSSNPIFDPRRDEMPQHRTLSAMLLGDPLPGRSALDQKRGAEV